MEILNSSAKQNKARMSAKTEEMMNSHPNLNSAPVDSLFENEEDRSYAIGNHVYHDAKSGVAPENYSFK